ncbi:hypothetical protein EMIHUDRAFT_257132 [Emiliania huxleyi CCMP1516]|uniref:Uncharacterized protein n=2 Tax=Emiliania huxleyi TaxID=2903 RepID=A0A0D3IMP0_EMIH1|nr:hypothetical protein EMIHUDRAFT_257132 [Emiliania huxleyi CCMP1516]EOD12525.1 hypothetical protein EMIHUDRAFT_257132 [Emiliania huxleyi CCMP1516]|eukprot:XP_005764954.1 hypothetical protein EMIHUDRAFT_257132 [Emiliania huxleyi CCMP1516]
MRVAPGQFRGGDAPWRAVSWGERGHWELGGVRVSAALAAPCGTGCGALATVARGMRVAPTAP